MASDAASVLAQKSGMKLLANQGKVDIQAQNDAIEIAAKQNVTIDSVEGKVIIAASKIFTSNSGGSYIKINGEGIEVGTSGNISIKSAALQVKSASTITRSPPDLPSPHN